MRRKYELRTLLSERLNLPIYTLPLLHTRLYIVNDAALASTIQRCPKDYSFEPFVILAADRLAGTSSNGMKLVRRPPLPGRSVSDEAHERAHRILTSLSDLRTTGHIVAQRVAGSLESLAAQSTAAVDLEDWVRQAFCIASTEAMYGPTNPFAKVPQLQKQFWEYESGLSELIMYPLPGLTAYRAYKSREAIAQAFQVYFETGGWTHGSKLVQDAYYTNTSLRLSLADQARFELTTCIGLLINAIPTVVWMLFHILSDLPLHEKVLGEVESCATITRDPDSGLATARLLFMDLRSSCPILHSTFKEVLRVYSTSLSARVVTRDTTLAGHYKLRQGSIVQIPGAVIHRDESQWGSNAGSFDAMRFLAQRADRESVAPRNPAAFRAFGGGSTLCPGRHFAAIEVLLFVAMFILRFDAKPLEEAWKVSEPCHVNLTTSVCPPPKRLYARLQERKGFEKLRWTFV